MLQQKKWQRQSVKFQNSLSVYVAGLPPQTSYWDLRNALAQFGEVSATFVSTLKPRQTHKYGFGCFRSRKSVELATQGELKILGAIVTVRQRTKSNWKNSESEAPRPYSGSEAVGTAVTHTDLEAAAQPELPRAHGDVALHYSQAYANGIRHVSSLTAASPFIHPPEFTEFVHDTLASQFRTQGRLRAALRPRLEMAASESSRKTRQISPKSRRKDDTGGKVARADGVPASWEAEDLFNFLKEQGVPVTNVLVYDDIDERGLRQALIQVASSQITHSLCEIGSLESLSVRLDFAASCINSIGPVRRTYAGNFTAFGGDVPSTEAYGYSVEEPREPLAQISHKPESSDDRLDCWPPQQQTQKQQAPVPDHISSNDAYSLRSAGSANSLSPAAEVDTPDTLVNPGSPIGKMIEEGFSDRGDSDTDNSEAHAEAAGPPCATSYFMSLKQKTPEFTVGSRDRGQYTQLEVSGKCTASPHSQQGCAPFYSASQVSMIFPKASQTVIVDNFDKRLIGDRSNLCRWVSRFGEVYTLDLVPLDERRLRAYISYMSPLDAQNTMHHLQLCMSGPFRLAVRLA